MSTNLHIGRLRRALPGARITRERRDRVTITASGLTYHVDKSAGTNEEVAELIHSKLPQTTILPNP